jgi:hypothetical protein
MPRIRVLLVFLTCALLLGAPAAHGAGSSLVVSQVYAGGGNTGATYANDFVELLNRGSSALDLTGWSIQYATASGTAWQATSLAGTLPAGHYYLVQLASAAAVGSTLPTPDATGTTNLAASGGKVALVHDTSALSCGATAGSCSAVATIADLVGWGGAGDYEGSAAAPALGATTAAVRADAGCTDSNANASDFTAAAPTPRNSASPAAACGGGTTTSSVAKDASVDVDIQSALSLSLDHPSLSFGSASTGQTPAALPEHVTVTSNDTAGYALTVHRTAFVPSDLPLGIGASAPTGGTLGSGVGASLVPIPIAAAADLLVGTAAAPSAASGDVWTTNVGFTAPLPSVAAGRYTATVTYTVIGR